MHYIVAVILALSLLTGCRQEIPVAGNLYDFSLDSIVSAGNGMARWGESRVFGRKVIVVDTGCRDCTLVLSHGRDSVPWEKAKYLVCEVWNHNPYSAILYVDFCERGESSFEYGMVQQGAASSGFSPETPRIYPKVGILPRLKTRVIIPLSYLDGQTIFMKRFPRQLKGTVMGHRLDKASIGKVMFRFEPFMIPGYMPHMEIASIYLTDSLPLPYEKPDPYVDEFGQWNQKDWPGKVHSETELAKKLKDLEKEAASARLPDDWSQFGGWKEKRFRASGFFRVQHDGKRWWFVDPEGYAFLSAGIDCIRDNAVGLISGQEDLFAWLPPDDSLYGEAYSNRGENTMLDFLQVNLRRIYGTDARTRWENLTLGLMKKWRINTIANWSDVDFARKIRYPYVLNMQNFPTTGVLLYRDFPDVYSDEYSKQAVDYAHQLESFREDKFLIGYFLSNEPHWAFGDNNLAFEMFAESTPSATKRAFVQWLEKKYRHIGEFNRAWNKKLDNFDQINSLVMKTSPSPNGWRDCNEFSGLMVDKYIQVVCDEVKKVDPHHLNLGLRYAWISSELCYRAGTYFDVFSINGYTNPGPPETAEIARRSGKPVIIGEYHFGAIDRGLPSTGIQGAESQEARGEAYRYYLEQGFARPEIIGIHYFQWMDQPVFGRFDGENYNIGFLDICMQPYEELTRRATLSHEAMYKIASGRQKPFDRVIGKFPQIYF